MTTSDYKQLQENFTPAKLVNEVLKIHKDISEITWILSSVPFNVETARHKIVSVNTEHPENYLFHSLMNPSICNCLFRKFTARFNLEKRLSGNQSKSKNLG